MSTIRIRRTAEVFYEVDPTLATLLCKGIPEIYEFVQIVPHKPAVHSWVVGSNAIGDRRLLVLNTPVGEKISYGGEPAQVEAFFKRGYEHYLPVPKNVLDFYAAEFERNRPRPTLTEAQREEINAAEASQRNASLWKYPTNY